MSDALVNGLAGAGGGIVAQIITYPVQTVNTRQQTERKVKRVTNRNSTSGVSEHPTRTLQQMYQVIKEEGWGGLYSGLMPSLVGTAASQGVYYYFYQIFRSRAEAIAYGHKRKGTGDGSVGIFSSLFVAAFAGCLNVLLTNPIWVVVTRMQTHTQAQKKILEAKRTGKDRERVDSTAQLPSTIPNKLIELGLTEATPYNTARAIQELYDEAGITGFWKGVIPTLIMVSNPSIQFMIYESLLKHLRARKTSNKLDNVTALEVFVLGAIAKLGATVATYPLLVVKSRLQAKQEIGGNKALQYTGTFDAIVKMIRYEGLAGFYKGMGTKIVQSVFAASVLFMIKEELVKAARTLVNRNRKIVQKFSIESV